MQKPIERLPQLRRPVRRAAQWPKIILGICVLGLAVACGGLVIISYWPSVAAQNVDRLRDIIGDAPVAQLEVAVLSVQDRTQQLEYRAGLVQPAAPWTDTNPTVIQPTPQNGSSADALPTSSSPALPLPSLTPPGNAAGADTNPAVIQSDSPAWHLSPLAPLGDLAGEGQWSPYIQAADGVTPVAYRTFLQPDPLRPYSVAAIVAFDLQATRLHFVLGSVEPKPLLPQPSRTGMIPAADLQPGVLLATFNGGFKARNGHYGAMADGLIALPPVDALATIAIYADGRVRIGEWGRDILDSPDLVAWRQNGKPLIADGQINSATTDPNEYWGLTLKRETITWRSALGVSADGRTLYYVAGPQLDVPPLSIVMARTGATQALQLDVNAFWVHFAAIRSDGSSLVAEPLLNAMSDQAARYLKGYSRDFFYVTASTR